MTYLRKAVESLDPYVPGIQPTDPAVIKLNTNENPYPPTDSVLKAIQNATGASLRLYPDPLSTDLSSKITEVYGVKSDQVVVGNGSDEIIAMIFRAAIDPGDRVLLFYPTYTLYYVLARLHDADVTQIQLDEQFELPETIGDGNYKLCFIPNPNVPGGNLISRQTIVKLARTIKGLLVVDEAYVDFAEENSIDLLSKHENIIITRTFSKSFSLAGLRIGFALAHKNIIEGLKKIKDSYNINRISAAAAKAALDDLDIVKKRIADIKKVRDDVAGRLKSLQFEVLPSQTNFLCAKPQKISARELYEELVKRKVLVRFFDHPRIDKYLRITIGTKEQMEILLTHIQEILKK